MAKMPRSGYRAIPASDNAHYRDTVGLHHATTEQETVNPLDVQMIPSVSTGTAPRYGYEVPARTGARNSNTYRGE